MSKTYYNKFKHMLVDPNEEILSILGNNVAETFIATGTIGNGFSILTDERVYFNGKCLVRNGKSFYRKLEERVVDLNDVTGTGFVHNRNIIVHFINKFSVKAALVLDVLLLPTVFLSGALNIAPLGFPWFLVVLFLILDRIFNYSVFEISFAGGGIGFDLSWVSESEAERFQKALRQAKDDKKKQQAQPVVPVSTVTSGNNMDDLVKLKELLDKGIITQEEFDAKKKQLLNI